MYNYKHNNYHLKPKNSSIQTPPAVSQFIFELLRDKVKVDKKGVILDPCSGMGNLLRPWKSTGYSVYGVDIESGPLVETRQDFLTWDGWDPYDYQVKPQLILCNPPFNGYGKKLGSEVWLDKIIELFGKDIPIVLFAPIGFRMNSTLKSKRHEKFDNGTYPPIVSQITLPKNIFEGVIFIFNIKGLQSRYFYKSYEP